MAPKLHALFPSPADSEHYQLHFLWGKWLDSMKLTLGIKLVLGLFLGLVVTGSASADTVWTYTGNIINYTGGVNPGPGGVAPPGDTGVNPCNCALDGTVTLDATNHAIAWSFTDGTDVLTNLNSTGTFNPFNCFGCSPSNPSPGSSPFQFWNFSLAGGGITMFSTFNGSFGDAQDSASSPSVTLLVEADPGTWTESGPVGTAEPATGLLLAVGLAIVGLMRRNKTKTGDSTVWESLG